MPELLLLFPQLPPHPRKPRAKPGRWADCPGEDCGIKGLGIPIEAAPEPWRFYPHEPDGDLPARLFCPACGLGWHGTDEEVEVSQRKEIAHQRREARGR